MKQYVIDELRPQDHDEIKQYLDDNFGPAEMGDLYWIPLEVSLYNDIQTSHSQCHPLYFVLQLSESSLFSELLVRTRNRVRCDCIGYANEEQLLWLIQFVDSIFERLEIIN